jgi:hypothetical protein
VHCFTEAGDCFSIHRPIQYTPRLKTDTFFFVPQVNWAYDNVDDVVKFHVVLAGQVNWCDGEPYSLPVSTAAEIAAGNSANMHDLSQPIMDATRWFASFLSWKEVRAFPTHHIPPP